VSFHRPNLAFDVRKVAGEADKLRVLGKLIQRLRRPGIVYCATVRAVDDLYVALRHGKIPVERYNGKMTTDEREKSQASFMSSGRKVVMIATNAFVLGVDKPDIRYIIHYQMPGSPESYVQEAGRAGRDGKPARCVLLFQPDDIAIQEHFLKEAHPTKTQARLVADGLYAWSDEGKEVSVRDLALSMALPERRVRVVLSVLEAMGVAKEVRAARWAGVEPRPTRPQIDKAASVFEARRISDRRRLAELLKYMNLQKCRVQMMREYFGEDPGPQCGLCDSCAGLDSEVFDPGDADARHSLHAATDFHGRTRRRRRRGVDKAAAPHVERQQRPTFATAIPELPPTTVPPPWVPPPESDATVDATVWDGETSSTPAAGEIVLEPGEHEAWLGEAQEQAGAETRPADTADVPGDGDPFAGNWAAVRDANIRPFIEWIAAPTVSLPVIPVARGAGAPPPRPNQQGNHHRHPQQASNQQPQGDGRGGKRRRRRRRGRNHDQPERDNGPRLPGVYNPGGD
jgi:hypothetical protein